MHRRTLVIAVLATAFIVLGGAAVGPASAATGGGFANTLGLSPTDRTTLQQRVADELSARPGGRQISQYEIAWDGGAVIMALPAPGRKAASPASPAALGSSDSVNVKAGAPVGASGVPATGSATAQTTFGDSGSCPYSLTTKWYCWYSDASFNGVRFQFSSSYCPGLAVTVINFGDWGRDNMATSWVNNRHSTINVWDGRDATGSLLWSEPSVSNSPNVGAWANDRASSARAC